MLWFAAHFPQLGLEIFEGRGIDHTGQPVVLTDDQKIVMTNTPAAEAGIVPGNSLATAYSLAPNLVHYGRDETTENEFLQALLAVCYRFSPVIAVAPPASLLVEVAGSLRLFHGVTRLAQDFKRRLRHLGHSAQLGMAHTPRLALALAAADCSPSLPDFPSAAEVQNSALGQLDRINLACTPLPPTTIERLRNMGLHTLGELSELPSHELSQRFAPPLLAYLEQVTGERPDPWPLTKPVPVFQRAMHLLTPLRDKAVLCEPMHGLLRHLVEWLDAQYLGLHEAEWGLYEFTGTGTKFGIQFTQPQTQFQALADITQLQLDKAELPEEVMSIGLRVERTSSRARVHGRSPDLLGNRASHVEPSHALVDRLIARLGADALQMLSVQDDHRPEYAWSPTATVAGPGTALATTQPMPAGARPLWLFEAPLPVYAKYFELLNGPERIECGWWDTELRRDYFVARHENGALCWIYCEDNEWFQHGYFA